jgi:hypothetical protein
MKLKLVYISTGDTAGIPRPHYEICTDEKEPKNICCVDWVVGDKFSQSILRKMIKLYNKEN